MPSVILLSIVLTLLLVTDNPFAEGDDCGSNKNFATRLTIDSHRNATGHWMSEVEILHSDKKEESRNPWALDVVQKTAKCDEVTGKMTNSNAFVSLDAMFFNPKKQRAPAPAPAASGRGASWQGLASHLLTTISVSGTPIGYSATSLSWADARHVCRDGMDRGGDLYALSGPSVPRVGRLLKEVGTDMAFVGFRRASAPPHDFRSTKGDLLSPEDSLHWSTGRPATKGPIANDACLTITKEGKLLDADCTVMLPFLCSPVTAGK